jgi:predicted site-specific integrase-resolvase
VPLRTKGAATPFMHPQHSLLANRATSEKVLVFKDRASRLRESRVGLDRMLKAAAAGEFTVVRVAQEDRLARFGVSWLPQLLAVHGVDV